MKKVLSFLHCAISYCALGLLIGVIIEVFRDGLFDSGFAMTILLAGVLVQAHQIEQLKKEMKK